MSVMCKEPLPLDARISSVGTGNHNRGPTLVVMPATTEKKDRAIEMQQLQQKSHHRPHTYDDNEDHLGDDDHQDTIVNI